MHACHRARCMNTWIMIAHKYFSILILEVLCIHVYVRLHCVRVDVL